MSKSQVSVKDYREIMELAMKILIARGEVKRRPKTDAKGKQVQYVSNQSRYKLVLLNSLWYDCFSQGDSYGTGTETISEYDW